MKKNTILYIVWAVLYCACVGFSFVSNRNLGGKIFLIGLNLVFYVPPFVLAIKALKEENRKALKTLRWISVSVLVLATVMLVLNILSVKFSARVGLIMYVLLAVLAPPLACAQQFALSLFLWACLLMLTIQKQRPYHK